MLVCGISNTGLGSSLRPIPINENGFWSDCRATKQKTLICLVRKFTLVKSNICELYAAARLEQRKAPRTYLYEYTFGEINMVNLVIKNVTLHVVTYGIRKNAVTHTVFRSAFTGARRPANAAMPKSAPGNTLFKELAFFPAIQIVSFKIRCAT